MVKNLRQQLARIMKKIWRRKCVQKIAHKKELATSGCGRWQREALLVCLPLLQPESAAVAINVTRLSPHHGVSAITQSLSSQTFRKIIFPRSRMGKPDSFHRSHHTLRFTGRLHQVANPSFTKVCHTAFYLSSFSSIRYRYRSFGGDD